MFLEMVGAYEILLYLSIMMALGLTLGKVASHFELPDIMGYILAGILLSGFGFVTHETVLQLEFVTNISLGFITFSFGTLLYWPNMKAHLKQILVVLAVEVLLIFGLTLALFSIFGQPLWFSLIMAAISIPTATAPIIEITKKHKAKGPLTNLICGIAGWDNLVAVFIFMMILPISIALKNDSTLAFSNFVPFLQKFGIAILLGILLGLLFGYLHRYVLVKFAKNDRHEPYLVSSLVVIFFGTSASVLLDVPYYITLLIAGFIFTNMLDKSSYEYETNTLDKFMPPFLIAFFVIAGAELNITNLVTYGGLTVLMILANLTGKYVGGWLGALAAPKTSEAQDKYLKTSLFTHGGIEIALASMAVIYLEDPRIKAIVLTVVLVYEFFAPLLLTKSLHNANEFMLVHVSDHKKDPVKNPSLEQEDKIDDDNHH
ncbi:MAG: cation:proton antiporter [Acholeplasmataceae bacterium]|nr:cation:proton antiporter [Acholeplasmataceae bacterium]